MSQRTTTPDVSADPASVTPTPGSVAPTPGSVASTTPAPRLGWLDALRGFAAVVVVAFHLSPYVIGPGPHAAVRDHIDLGKYGVLLFFLVSGYVIPMSLERHGSLRRFWLGRLFRIYPAFLAASALVGVLIVSGVLSLTLALQRESAAGLLAHVTMQTDLLGVRGLVRVFWTLSYEMTFYLMVAGLFGYGLHRRSAWWASGLAVTALLAGPLLPDDLLTPGLQSRRIVAALLIVAVTGSITGWLWGRRTAVRLAGVVGIGFVVLPAVNGSSGPYATVISSWQALLMLAVMFAGTVVYHAQYGLIGRRAAAFALTAVATCLLAGHWIHLDAEVSGAAALADQRRMWVGTVVAVVGTFAVAFAARHRRVPRVLAWCGTVSYSLYLLHAIVLLVFLKVLPQAYARPMPQRVGITVAFLVVAFSLAWLSYRTVERPAQLWGRRLARRLDERAEVAAAPARPRQRR